MTIETVYNTLATREVFYKKVESSVVPTCNGIIIILPNYKIIKRGSDDDFGLSIALSYLDSSWGNKCWLSVKIPTENNSQPLLHPPYKDFESSNINYYAYSINTSGYKADQILNLCGGLVCYVEQNTSRIQNG